MHGRVCERTPPWPSDLRPSDLPPRFLLHPIHDWPCVLNQFLRVPSKQHQHELLPMTTTSVRNQAKQDSPVLLRAPPGPKRSASAGSVHRIWTHFNVQKVGGPRAQDERLLRSALGLNNNECTQDIGQVDQFVSGVLQIKRLAYFIGWHFSTEVWPEWRSRLPKRIQRRVWWSAEIHE